MTRTSSNDQAGGIIILILIGIGIILGILVFIVHMFQILFRICLVGFLLGLIALLIAGINDIFFREKNNDWGFYHEEKYWISYVLIFLGITFILSIFFYYGGYGATAQGILEVEEDYNEFIYSIFGYPQDQMNQALHEAHNETCKNYEENIGCDLAEQAIETYEFSQEVDSLTGKIKTGNNLAKKISS